jgi:hypothetical protein
MGARHLAHEQDHGEHDKRRRCDCCATSDVVSGASRHNGGAGAGKDQQEGAEQLAEKAAPLLSPVTKVALRK